jgi:DNA polymerase-3 subunit delta
LTVAARPRNPTAFLIVGADSHLRATHRQAVIGTVLPEGAREFAVTRFSSEHGRLAEALALAATRPMLSPRQVILLTEADALPEDDLPLLEAYFAAPAEFTVLVFEAAKLDRRTRAARLLEDNCELLDAGSPDDAGATDAAARYARELGLRMGREALEDLMFAVGTDQGSLRSEVAKLRAYVGEGREATPDDVAAVVRPAREFSVFALVDLLADRRGAQALALLHRLLEAGENPVGMVGLLAWLYRQLLVARSLSAETPAWKANQSLRAPAARVPELLRQARRFTAEELRAAFAALREADSHLKSGAPNPEAILETLVVRLTASVSGRPVPAPAR